MKRTRHTTEEMIRTPRGAALMEASGSGRAEIVQKLGGSEQTLNRWRKPRYGDRRIHAMVEREGFRVGRDRVHRLCQRHRLRVPRRVIKRRRVGSSGGGIIRRRDEHSTTCGRPTS